MRIEKPALDAVEKRELRTAHSKTFELPDGKRHVEIRHAPVCYRSNDGQLRSCDTTVQKVGNRVFVEWLPYSFELHETGIGFDFKSRTSGSVRVSLTAIGDNPFNSKRALKPTVAGDTITFSDVEYGVDIVFKILPSRVKTLRIVKDSAASRQFEWLCEYDADGAKYIDNSLSGTDSRSQPLDLQCDVRELTANSSRIVETWSGLIKVRDRKTRVKSLSDNVEYPVAIDPTVTVNPAATADDGHALVPYTGGTWYDSSVRLGYYLVSYWYDAGLRFPSVNVPQGSTITSATLTIQVASVFPVAPSGTIWGYATDNASAFSSGTLPAGVAKTTASTAIASATVGSHGYDVTAIVQEIVDRAGWVANNAIGIPILKTGYGIAVIEDYQDGLGNPASLSITYAGGGGGTVGRIVTINQAVRRASTF